MERVLASDPVITRPRWKRRISCIWRIVSSRHGISRQGIADGGILSLPVCLEPPRQRRVRTGQLGAAAGGLLRRAIDLQPEMPLFLQNAGRARRRRAAAAEAADLYLRAARLLFAEETFDELSLVVPRAACPRSRNPRHAMEAKMLYREGKTDEAFALLQRSPRKEARTAPCITCSASA